LTLHRSARKLVTALFTATTYVQGERLYAFAQHVSDCHRDGDGDSDSWMREESAAAASTTSGATAAGCCTATASTASTTTAAATAATADGRALDVR